MAAETARRPRQARTPFKEWILRNPGPADLHDSRAGLPLSPIYEDIGRHRDEDTPSTVLSSYRAAENEIRKPVPEVRETFFADDTKSLVPYKSRTRRGSDVEPIIYSRHTRKIEETDDDKDRLDSFDILDALRETIKSPDVDLPDDKYKRKTRDDRDLPTDQPDVDHIIAYYLGSESLTKPTVPQTQTTTTTDAPRQLTEQELLELVNLASDPLSSRPSADPIAAGCSCCKDVNEVNIKHRPTQTEQQPLTSLSHTDSSLQSNHPVMYGPSGMAYVNFDKYNYTHPKAGGRTLDDDDDPRRRRLRRSVLESDSLFNQAMDRFTGYVEKTKRKDAEDYFTKQQLLRNEATERISYQVAARHRELYERDNWNPLIKTPVIIPKQRRQNRVVKTPPLVSLQPDRQSRLKSVTFSPRIPQTIEYTPENSSLSQSSIRH